MASSAFIHIVFNNDPNIQSNEKTMKDNTGKLGEILESIITHDYSRGRSAIECAMKSSCEVKQGLFLLGKSYMLLMLKDHKNCLEQLDQIKPSFIYYKEAQFLKAKAYIMAGKWLNAVEILKDIESPKSDINLLYCYSMTNCFQEAIDLSYKLSKIDSYRNQGRLAKYLLQERFQKILDFNIKSNIEEEIDDYNTLRALSFYKLGDMENSINTLIMILEKNNKNEFAWNLIAAAYGVVGYNKDCFWCLIKSSEFNSESWIVWYNLALLFKKTKQNIEFAKSYKKAQTLNPSVPELVNFIIPFYDISMFGKHKSQYVPERHRDIGRIVEPKAKQLKKPKVNKQIILRPETLCRQALEDGYKASLKSMQKGQRKMMNQIKKKFGNNNIELEHVMNLQSMQIEAEMMKQIEKNQRTLLQLTGPVVKESIKLPLKRRKELE
ncbi:hypothetical protein SteCoe_3994 [Stentor coeruleus]|uniref:Uncharacterized protein n=1 Tax=Stentor coeruleus TaxID=5963 RepID=A0A1R2CVP8_9CILI|nr:hypothetical protein SteCoe_17916 [Stentor coeruleus]OMJ93055.1 hypothetical protein SteCoe_3994 [Stentor coeruleus]